MKAIDWPNLSFGYMKTDYNVRSEYKNGKWSTPKETTSEYIDIHMAATCLHYGQEAFEGLKAFRGKDGKIRVFRLEENAKRLQASSRGIMMAEFPTDLFRESVIKAIKLNEKYIPPYGSGASLYIRPLLIGTTAGVGVRPAEDYLFVVFVSPVGPYFKEGFKPSPVAVMRGYDRAAPLGTGTIKVGGNYAASLVPGRKAQSMGYSAVLFLDAKEKKYLDECGPANFYGIKNNTYITPKSDSILPSITNDSLIILAEEIGLKIERRPVPIEELAEFEEAGQVGTAAVISPILKVDDIDKGTSYIISKNGEAGKISTKLYNKLKAIQQGDEPDKYGWNTIVE